MAKLATTRILRFALKAATPSLSEIARQAGLGYHAVRRYREGVRQPKAQVLELLAGVLRRRAEKLIKYAVDLESAAKRG